MAINKNKIRNAIGFYGNCEIDYLKELIKNENRK